MLVGKNKQWEWRKEQQEAFEELKRRFIAMNCLGQAFVHQKLAAVIDRQLWELGVASLERHNY